MDIKNIYRIYNNFVKINENSEYCNRYSELPLEFNNKNWKWENKDFPRVIALLEFKKFMENNNNFFNNVLSFNGSTDPEYEYIKFNNRINYDYDKDKINNDLHNLNLNKKDFDFVMLNQTIEHLYDPIRCLQNVYKHLNKGAIFYANVPVNNIPHSTPEHYYTGITPTGLGVMTEIAGFEILEIGQWGNFDYLTKIFTIGWTDYRNSLSHNEINCPLITWIFARKVND
jgi:SAM-dependent methyltransferase